MDEIDEATLLEIGRSGRVFDGGAGNSCGVVSAAVIRRCCLDLQERIDPRGLRFRNVTVAGCLDLAGLEVSFPLRFATCEFDSEVCVEGAQLAELALTRCTRLPGLLGNGLRVRRDLDLSGSHLTGGHATAASTSKRA